MVSKRLLSVFIGLSAVIFWIGCGQKSFSEKAATDHSTHEGKAQVSQEGVNMEGKELILQKTCPVMGNSINKSLFVDFQGKRIYVCCQECVDEVKKDPQKYLDKLESMGEKAEEIPSPDEKR